MFGSCSDLWMSADVFSKSTKRTINQVRKIPTVHSSTYLFKRFRSFITSHIGSPGEGLTPHLPSMDCNQLQVCAHQIISPNLAGMMWRNPGKPTWRYHRMVPGWYPKIAGIAGYSPSHMEINGFDPSQSEF